MLMKYWKYLSLKARERILKILNECDDISECKKKIKPIVKAEILRKRGDIVK